MHVPLDVSVTVQHQYNEVSNQQGAITFTFINLFKSALHVSGYRFAHPQEHFRLYIQLLVQYTDTTPVPSQPWHLSAAVSVYCTKSCIYSQMCSWGWANLSPEKCRVYLKRLTNVKVVAFCWLLRCAGTSCNANHGSKWVCGAGKERTSDFCLGRLGLQLKRLLRKASLIIDKKREKVEFLNLNGVDQSN